MKNSNVLSNNLEDLFSKCLKYSLLKKLFKIKCTSKVLKIDILI